MTAERRQLGPSGYPYPQHTAAIERERAGECCVNCGRPESDKTVDWTQLQAMQAGPLICWPCELAMMEYANQHQHESSADLDSRAPYAACWSEGAVCVFCPRTNDGEARGSLGAALGEIPAASAGMTVL